MTDSSLTPDAASANAELVAHRKVTRITPHGGWLDFNLKEVWDARELIMRFVHRDFIASYKQTILGPLWFVLPPLATTLIFTIIFGRVAKIPTDGAPDLLFFMVGTVLWNYFAGCLTRASNTFTSNAGLFGKIYIPRLAVPISLIISNLIGLLIQCVMFAGFYAWYYFHGAHIHPNALIFALPLVLLQLAVLGLGVGCLVASLTTYYRDVAMILGFGVQLAMYASCVVNPLSLVSPQWRWLVALNPIVPVLEMTRNALFGTAPIDPIYLATSVATTLVLFFIGLVAFKRMERTFMDTV